jgi:hypothetical protein
LIGLELPQGPKIVRPKRGSGQRSSAKQEAAKEALDGDTHITTSDATSSGATGGETEEDSFMGASQSSVDYLQSPTLPTIRDTEDECFVASRYLFPSHEEEVVNHHYQVDTLAY